MTKKQSKQPYPTEGYFDDNYTARDAHKATSHEIATRPSMDDATRQKVVNILGLSMSYMVATFVALITIAVIVFGIFSVNQYLNKKSIDNNNTNVNHSEGYQRSLISQEEDLVNGIEQDTRSGANNPNVAAQITQEKQEFCTNYSNITDPPNDLKTDHSHYCK